MSKSEKNLREAFAGESQAYQRYLAFAERAADEYKEGVYLLFQAIAESERIHARRHLGYLKRIRSTAENLQEAIEGEAQEFETMYPKMLAEAKEEKEDGPAISFSHAGEVEKAHHKLFKRALKDPEKFPVQDYYICNACGYIAEKKPPDKCPVCGAVRKGFYKVINVKSR